MSTLRLTDITLAQSTAITPTTLIHIVTTGDTTQFSGGSSYKAELSQLTSLFSGGSITKEVFYKSISVNISLGFVPYFMDVYTDGGTDPAYVNGIIPNDLSSLISAELMVIPEFTASEGTNYNLSYGQTGDQFSANTVSSGETISYTYGEVKYIDVYPIFSSVTSNDFFIFDISQNNVKLFVPGLRLRYAT